MFQTVERGQSADEAACFGLSDKMGSTYAMISDVLDLVSNKWKGCYLKSN